MPPTRGILFLNPSSGSKLLAGQKDALKEAAAEAGLEVIPLAGGMDVTQTIRERLGRGMKLFVAAGGDGTIHHVIQPLVNSEAVLGVIPAGTYNHFARDLNIPLDWREALDVVLTGQIRQVDAARVNDRF